MYVVKKIKGKEIMPEILIEFDNYLLGIRGFSFNTVKAYNTNLMLFFNFIISYMDLKIKINKINTLVLLQVRKSDIIAFLVYCNFERDNTPTTRQCKLAAIKTFYKWLLHIIPGEYIKENPTNDISIIEEVEKLPKYLSLDQAKKIQEIFTIKNSKFPIRNNAIISTFLSTGARATELINTNLGDLDLNANTLTVIGKGNKERILYLSNTCKEKLNRYLEQRNRHKKNISPNDPLFLNKNGSRIGIDCVENICKNAYKLIGLSNYKYTTHTLRHTAASIIYLYVKQDILLLKEFLGHKNISSTQIYTHISNKQVKEAINKNPLNNFKKSKKREGEAA